MPPQTLKRLWPAKSSKSASTRQVYNAKEHGCMKRIVRIVNMTGKYSSNITKP